MRPEAGGLCRHELETKDRGVEPEGREVDGETTELVKLYY